MIRWMLLALLVATPVFAIDKNLTTTVPGFQYGLFDTSSNKNGIASRAITTDYVLKLKCRGNSTLTLTGTPTEILGGFYELVPTNAVTVATDYDWEDECIYWAEGAGTYAGLITMAPEKFKSAQSISGTVGAYATGLSPASALIDVNLGHLVGTATGIPMIVTGTYVDQLMDDGTAVYDRATDSLQALRDRGDIAWVTGGAASICFLTGTAAIASTTTTIVDVTNLTSSQANAYVGMIGETNSESFIVSAFNPATDTITLTPALSSEPDSAVYCLTRASFAEILVKVRSIRR